MREPNRCSIQVTGKVEIKKIIWNKGMLKGNANWDKTVFTKERKKLIKIITRQGSIYIFICSLNIKRDAKYLKDDELS